MIVINNNFLVHGISTEFMLLLFFAGIIFLIVALGRTRREMAENKISDATVGIGNISYFEKYFHSIPEFAKSKYYIAYIKLDSTYLSIYHSEEFFSKAVNYVASVISSFEVQNDFVARITENGFAYAFKANDAESAKNKLQKLIDKLRLLNNTEGVEVKNYFKTAVYNVGVKDRNVDLMLYNLRENCRASSGDDVVWCDTHMMNSALEEKEMLEAIEKGFENDEFKLYLQFIVDNNDKKIVSAECLSRWQKANGEIVPPLKYISIMERTGIISKLDYFMFEKACRKLQEWKGTEFGGLTLSCNFTRITISEKDFVSRLEEILNKYDFDRKKLLIEITEDAIEKNLVRAMENIIRAKDLGFRIALDDLGSGYTSLTNLCEYPIDVVKIDRYILLMTDKKQGEDLFKGIISLVHSLNLKVVCEGVETDGHNNLVSETECDYIQGWYYSKPMNEVGAETFAKEYMVR